MASILPFDEINAMVGQSIGSDEEEKKRKKEAEIIEDILSILIWCYLKAVRDTADSLGVPIEDSLEEMYAIIWMETDGKTFEDRVVAHLTDGHDGLVRSLAESEAHRVYEAGAYHAAERAEKEFGISVGKVWHTMRDDRVRDTHDYLEGNVVGLHEEFYTFDGDHAFYPGGFGKVENNANCRCHIECLNLDRSGAVPVIGQGRP